MSDDQNKYLSRENRTKLRRLFMEAWDPIGVCNVPEAQDEYDTYVAKLYVMLMYERASQQSIADYLYEVVTDRMGFPPSPKSLDDCARAAGLIVGLRPNFERHSAAPLGLDGGV